MAKVRLTGKVVTDVVSGTIGQNNTKYIKYLVEVAIANAQNNNPRMAQDNVKKSYFAVIAYGKQAEFPIQKGVTIEIDGQIEIAKFQLTSSSTTKEAVIVTPEHTTILQGNVVQYAKAYNLLGNLVKDDADVYVPQSGGNSVYTQKVATSKKVGDNEYPSFYAIKFFGERGDKLFSRQLLSKSKVKAVLVDGSISATYTKKENNGETKEYFNVDINVNDFQIASFKSNTSGEIGTAQQALAKVGTYDEPPIEYYDGFQPQDEVSEDEIPF